MKNRTLGRVFASITLATACLLSSPTFAAEYPPAMNYDNLTDFVYIGETDSKMLFSNKLYSMRYYLPGRDAQIRIDVVDQSGKIMSTKERVYFYENGKALSNTKFESGQCKVECLNGPGAPKLDPGLYWLVFSEHGKVFSAEWFEVRAYQLGEGRFAKGQITYHYLPTTQMAKLSLEDGELRVEAGFAGESEVGDKNSIVKQMKATLKYNGQLFAKLPGNSAHRISLEPYTQMHNINLSLAKNNSIIKKADMKDGDYELDIMLDDKAYRKFKFQVKAGKIVYQGRQKESSQPPERMIISEKNHWLWNTYVAEPTRIMPKYDLNVAHNTQPTAANNSAGTPQPTATPMPTAEDAIGDVLKKIPKLPF